MPSTEKGADFVVVAAAAAVVVVVVAAAAVVVVVVVFVVFVVVVDCLTSQPHTNVIQGRICLNKCGCCHTKIKVPITLAVSSSYSLVTARQEVLALPLWCQAVLALPLWCQTVLALPLLC